MSAAANHARQEEGRFTLPARPAMPPVLYALVAVLLTSHAVLSHGLSRVRPCAGMGWALWGAAGLVVLSLLMSMFARRAGAHSSGATSRWCRVGEFLSLVTLVAIAILAGVIRSSASLLSGDAFVRAVEERGISSWKLVVVSDPTLADHGRWRMRTHARGTSLPAGDLWLMASEAYEIGDVLHVSEGFKANDDDEWGRINRTQGIWGRVMPHAPIDVQAPTGLDALIRTVRDRARGLLAPFSSEGRAILAGCVIGDRRAMDSFGLDEAFASCGVSHLIAVSGGHIVIMSQLLGVVVERLRVRRGARLALLAGLSGLYVLLTGAPTPAVRSWIMALVGFGARLVGRRADALSALALVGLGMALLDPGCVGQVGFILSVVCVGSLCAFSTYAAYALKVALGVRMMWRLPHSLERGLRQLETGLCDVLGATCVAQLATLPVCVPIFLQVSLVAPLANMLLALPFAALIGVGLLACLFPLPLTWSQALLAPCDLLASLVIWLLRRISSIPYASIPFAAETSSLTLVLCLLALVLLVLWPPLTHRHARLLVGGALAIIVVHVVRWGLLAPARVVILDIGQGDAVLVQDGSAAVLIDAGPDAAIRAALARNNVLHLDAVVITHLHDDHYGGLTKLPGFVGVDEVLFADGVTSADGEGCYWDSALEGLRQAVGRMGGPHEATCLRVGDTLRVGTFSLQVLWPREPVDGTENAHSIELSVSYARDGRTMSALLTGDAEREETAAATEAAGMTDIDLLKVGHHGSATSLSAATAQTLSPLVAVASAGEANRYGHPTATCVATLEGVGAVFLCTKDVGDVCVSPGHGGPEVSCQHPCRDPSL